MHADENNEMSFFFFFFYFVFLNTDSLYSKRLIHLN